jgi:hypothetical protein
MRQNGVTRDICSEEGFKFVRVDVEQMHAYVVKKGTRKLKDLRVDWKSNIREVRHSEKPGVLRWKLICKGAGRMLHCHNWLIKAGPAQPAYVPGGFPCPILLSLALQVYNIF